MVTATCHQLFQSPSHWLGRGEISFSESEDYLAFYARWTVARCSQECKECSQEIEIEGISERMHNAYLVRPTAPGSFLIELVNPVVGQVEGAGLIDDRVIAWEFRDLASGGFEGFESYELQPDGSYTLHAEYTSASQLRTIVNGELWRTQSTIET